MLSGTNSERRFDMLESVSLHDLDFRVSFVGVNKVEATHAQSRC